MRAALAEFSELWGSDNAGRWQVALAQRQQFHDLWAELIGAEPGSLTSTENVTASLCSFVGSLPESALRGRKLLIAADCFPSMYFLLAGLAARHGFTLTVVPLRPGEHWVRDEDFIAAWDGEVGLALLTLVSSTTSHRIDLDRLVAHGRAHGSLMAADITQAAGIIPFDVTRYRLDAVISTSLKWLCGAPGAGILYVKPDLIPQCQPEFRGWFSQEDPFSWALDQFRFAPDIRRFDQGTPALLSAIASVPALRFMRAQGLDTLAVDNRQKTRHLLARAQAAGWRCLSPASEEARGGSLMFEIPEPLDPEALVAELAAARFACDKRSRTLRLSPGIVTRIEDIDHLADLLGERLAVRR